MLDFIIDVENDAYAPLPGVLGAISAEAEG